MTDHSGAGFIDPVPPPWSRVLRRAVLGHGQRHGSRRSIHPELHVGVPGAPELIHNVSHGETDHALRTEIVAAMVAPLVPVTAPWTPLVWLTRGGPLAPPEDVDLGWLAAAQSAYAELGLPLAFVTVNRHGWRDPRTGVGTDWVRLRAR